jgi:hypothetical protein
MTKNQIQQLKGKIAFVLMFTLSGVFAQERSIEDIHSMMVFNFIKYVQWPAKDNAKEFVIGVVGNDEVFNKLNAWYGGKANGGKIYVIKKYSTANEIGDCQLIYLDKSKSGEFAEIESKLKGKNTLVVTNKSGLGAKGSCINFKTVDDKLKFELNKNAMEAANLKVSGSLTAMAILI